MRYIKYRRDALVLWIALVIVASLVLITKVANAGDYNEDNANHTIVLSINEAATGNPVSTQSPRVAVMRASDQKYYDFNDSTFKLPASATTLFASMTYNTTGGFYYKTVSFDNASILVPTDYITVISNDDASFGTTSAENITFGTLNRLIKIHQ